MNKVIIIGRLSKEPAISEKFARYTIAVDRPFKQEGQQEADFINCVVFGKSISFVEDYLHKGMKIAIEGRLQTGSYEKDGVKHYTTDVVVDRHEFCESRRNDDSAPAPITMPSGNIEDLKQFSDVVHFNELDEQEQLPW